MTEEYMDEDLIRAIENYKAEFDSARKEYTKYLEAYNQDGLILSYFKNAQFPMRYKNSSSEHTAGNPFPSTSSVNYDELKSLYEKYIEYSSITDYNDPNYLIDDPPVYSGTNFTYYEAYINGLVSSGVIDRGLADEMIREYESKEPKSLEGAAKDYIDYTYNDLIRYRLDELNKLVDHENEVEGKKRVEGGIKAAIEGQQAVYMEAGYGEIPISTDSAAEMKRKKMNYYNYYYRTTLVSSDIGRAIKLKQDQLDVIQNHRDYQYEQMKEIQKKADIKKYFTAEQWDVLSRFIREDTLNDSNFVVTDTMSAEEILEMKQSFLEFGQKELNRVSQPEFTFKLSMANIFALQEFKDNLDDFEIYNYVTVLIRDDYYAKVKILSFEIDFEDRTNISIEFATMYKFGKSNVWDTAIDAMATANSAATSVSFNRFSWNKADENSNDIQTMIEDGLLNAGATLHNSRSTFTVDDRGIFMSRADKPDVGAALTGSNLLFTTDNWNTVRSALGAISYTDNTGRQVNNYGLIAEAVLAGYVYGSYISGSTIYGDEIIGGSITGTTFNNNNGTFSVDANGYMRASSGTIGGWNLTGDSLYTGDITQAYTDNTVRLSSTAFSNGYQNNLRLAIGSKFAVAADGTLYASGGSIGGWTVSGNTLLSSNGLLTLDANGNGSVRSSKTSRGDTQAGFWLSRDGLSIGTGNQFEVTDEGSLYAKSGNIGGWNLRGSAGADDQYLEAGSTRLNANGSMQNTNGTWWINADGSASFSNVSITGGSIGMGGATINASGWDFSGLLSSASGLSTGVNFGGVTLSAHISTGDANTLSAAKIYADSITAKFITADYITTDLISSKIASLDFVTIQALRVGNPAHQLSWYTVKDTSGKDRHILGY